MKQKPELTKFKPVVKEIPKMAEFEYDEVVSILLGVKPEKSKISKKHEKIKIIF